MSRRRTSTGARQGRSRGLRTGAARLVWGLCSGVALVLAGAVLLSTLRADAAATPWSQWFRVAELVTPAPVAEIGAPEVGLFRAEAWDVAFGWGLAALAWLGLGLVLTLVLRPSRPQAPVATHTRRVNDSEEPGVV